MHQGKWEDLLDKIEKMFGFVEHRIDEYPERRMTFEMAVFDGASGRIKLERTVKPVVLDAKTTYSKRVGSEVVTEYVLSDDEYVDTVQFFRWDTLAREWKQIDIADIGR
jgi:transcriptional regulator NrdR family protein